MSVEFPSNLSEASPPQPVLRSGLRVVGSLPVSEIVTVGTSPEVLCIVETGAGLGSERYHFLSSARLGDPSRQPNKS
jgi:hypothetical protein